MSQITTHVLDTALGKPAKGVPIELQAWQNEQWETLASGITNDDGRISDLLANDQILPPANYRMVFDTATYFQLHNTQSFYPQVAIQFTIFDQSHYHIPLLLSPYGYTTYRGS